MTNETQGLTKLAAHYLIDHEGELHTVDNRPFTHEEFEELRKDFTLELEGAISDRWTEWRDNHNDRLHT